MWWIFHLLRCPGKLDHSNELVPIHVLDEGAGKPHYHEVGNIDRVYEDALSVMESCGYQVELAGAALLGYDTGLILEQDARQAVLSVLESTTKRDRLVVHMSRALNIDSRVPAGFVDQFERGLRLVIK